MRSTAWIAVATASLVGAVASSWPMMLQPWSHLPGIPGAEVADHLWSLWVALESGPIVVRDAWINVPQGFNWVVADPLNLLWFALGVIGGPIFAFCLVQLSNLWIAGMAGAALWRHVYGGSTRGALFAALMGPMLPVLAGGLLTGMTEAQTFGWIGLAVAALWRATEEGGVWIAIGGVLVGACAWAGAYTGLYGAIAVLVVSMGLLVTSDTRGRVGSRLGIVGVIALVIAIPIIKAIVVDRAAIAAANPELPGSASLAVAVFSDPDLPKNKMLSGDLLGLMWPRASHGIWAEGASGAVAAQHVSYLGAVFVALAVLGAVVRRRERAVRVMLPLVVVMVVLGLGYHLQVNGRVLRLFDTPLLLPGGFLSAKIPFFGQAARWYRAHVVVGILLLPLAAAGMEWIVSRAHRRSHAIAIAIGLAILASADALGSGALAGLGRSSRPRLRRDSTSWTAMRPCSSCPLPEEVARPTHCAIPHLYGRSGMAVPSTEIPWWDGRKARMRGWWPSIASSPRRSGGALPEPAQEACAEAAAMGFGWLVHLPGDERLRIPLERATAALGEPDVRTDAVWAWKLHR